MRNLGHIRLSVLFNISITLDTIDLVMTNRDQLKKWTKSLYFDDQLKMDQIQSILYENHSIVMTHECHELMWMTREFHELICISILHWSKEKFLNSSTNHDHILSNSMFRSEYMGTDRYESCETLALFSREW